jgi:hypothetical protein
MRSLLFGSPKKRVEEAETRAKAEAVKVAEDEVRRKAAEVERAAALDEARRTEEARQRRLELEARDAEAKAWADAEARKAVLVLSSAQSLVRDVVVPRATIQAEKFVRSVRQAASFTVLDAIDAGLDSSTRVALEAEKRRAEEEQARRDAEADALIDLDFCRAVLAGENFAEVNEDDCFTDYGDESDEVWASQEQEQEEAEREEVDFVLHKRDVLR